MARTQECTGPRGPSKYAQKRAAIASGDRKPFEFVDKARPASRPSPQRPVSGRGNVSGVVERVFHHPGYTFIVLNGRTFYLRDKTLGNYRSGAEVKAGDYIDCDAQPPRPDRKPRITHIYTIIPAR